ncbi:FecR family protein [Dyella mobilis]|uniref:FecR domain-containing protein n=1 Tax=Dyella mobilis TaxID=1849582 RepID=A0ABS2KMI6_9GAMM|nr:FecR domain-containing protein [Dyella mobilis]MBM7132363.1 FecR domain-containing protein [Dyella mobilis]GLQ95649.1 peptide ABC transporter substrate-binding protein [Dyella mobilis]
MATSKQNDILHVAADWWVRLRAPDANDDTVDQWLAWTQEDARHLETFERVSDLASRLGTLDQVSRQSLIQAFARPSARQRRWLPLAAAASVAVALLSGGLYLGWMRLVPGITTQVYNSAIAQNRDFTLSDGTKVALGAASTMTTQFGRNQRRIELKDGEAFFQVVHDNSRPFVVAAGDIAVRDIGTAFDVRRTGERVTIVVTQGRVEISDVNQKPGQTQRGTLEVSAGQMVSYDPNASGMTVGSMTPEQATAWRSDRLEFIDEPLAVVIANLNRYSPRPLHIADTDLDKLSYTGSIRTDAIDSWLGALPQVFPLRVNEKAGGVTLSDAEHPSRR